MSWEGQEFHGFLGDYLFPCLEFGFDCCCHGMDKDFMDFLGDYCFFVWSLGSIRDVKLIILVVPHCSPLPSVYFLLILLVHAMLAT